MRRAFLHHKKHWSTQFFHFSERGISCLQVAYLLLDEWMRLLASSTWWRSCSDAMNKAGAIVGTLRHCEAGATRKAKQAGTAGRSNQDNSFLSKLSLLFLHNNTSNTSIILKQPLTAHRTHHTRPENCFQSIRHEVVLRLAGGRRPRDPVCCRRLAW